jgi:hypothetical protein
MQLSSLGVLLSRNSVPPKKVALMLDQVRHDRQMANAKGAGAKKNGPWLEAPQIRGNKSGRLTAEVIAALA